MSWLLPAASCVKGLCEQQLILANTMGRCCHAGTLTCRAGFASDNQSQKQASKFQESHYRSASYEMRYLEHDLPGRRQRQEEAREAPSRWQEGRGNGVGVFKVCKESLLWLNAGARQPRLGSRLSTGLNRWHPRYGIDCANSSGTSRTRADLWWAWTLSQCILVPSHWLEK